MQSGRAYKDRLSNLLQVSPCQGHVSRERNLQRDFFVACFWVTIFIFTEIALCSFASKTPRRVGANYRESNSASQLYPTREPIMVAFVKSKTHLTSLKFLALSSSFGVSQISFLA